MADKKLQKLLGEAQKAYQKGDKRKGAQIVDQILRKDFAHSETWELLYAQYGAGRSFDEFQRAFIQQYYPDKLSMLDAGLLFAEAKQPAASAPEKKPSFLGRLFGRKSSPSPAPAPSPAAKTARQAAPPAQAATPPPEAPAPAPRPASQPPTTRPAPTVVPSITPPPSPSSVRPPVQAGPAAVSPTPAPARRPTGQKITILVVDDIAQTRENVIRSLTFQENFEVIGSANNGLQAIEQARALKPDVILMDVNMPDMDGITATARIKQEVPFSQIIILTVQDDMDYIRRAMLAGARDFLAKPPMIDELIVAVERAAELAHRERQKVPALLQPLVQEEAPVQTSGKVITVYSPRGGVGCTTLTTNLALVLNSEESPVVALDGNLQFGDLPVFFNVQSKNSILELAPRAEELDQDLVEEVLIKHDSGVKILAPPRPEQAEIVTGDQFARLLIFLSDQYAYTLVDTTHRLTDVTLAALDRSDLIILIVTQDIPCIARVRKFLDLVPVLNLDPKRILVVMNQFDKRVGVTPEKVGMAFNHPVEAVLPFEFDVVVSSVNRGTPFVAQKETASRPISQAVQNLAEVVRQRFSEPEKSE